MGFGKSQRAQIEQANERFKEADGGFSGDTIFQPFREKQRLEAIQTNAMIHA